ncbi:class I SAM-dependent RNA methyltransferase [Rhodococcus rhodnii]|uniref:RNA methyltransferase n=2 Tax=Rhodococcus rhodnii TaxID=38312 RepID=R7WSA2_9NOCA|nr:TRAM domain-containing protein [Rhodococcus rhodnii]EOM78198.1 RNA methyltransferase [Rhodococcus rhodnii LMG 5362]TXG90950.1 class I SAM-dependent RNA methyltransferase [Rhodococcus rhodnii]
MTGSSWLGAEFETTLGGPGHGGFVVGRHEGRVVFVRHGLPGERVRVRVHEDRGGSFCRAEVTEILDASPDRIDPLCPISGPGGAGCCDFSYATPELQRSMKSRVVSDLLSRIARDDREIGVEEMPGGLGTTGWRRRVRLGVDEQGRAGHRRYRSNEIVADLRCPQMLASAYEGIGERQWRPGAEIAIALDSDDARHVVEIAPPRLSRTARFDRGRRGAAARRAAESRPRDERVVLGSGEAVERVGSREWTLAPTGFWQAHRTAPQTYSQLVAEWAAPTPGDIVWDLYGGVGVFAAAVAPQVGEVGRVDSVESSPEAHRLGVLALADLAQIRLHPGRVEGAFAALTPEPTAVILDPPRSGAGKAVVAAVADAAPERIVHIGCDPASFARDLALYTEHGYRAEHIRAFDAFPLTHHVECVALLVR